MAHIPNFLDRVGSWALIVGALAFGIFWEVTLSDLDIPWMAALSIHGLSLATMAFGLIQLERSAVTERSWVGRTAVAVTIIGSFASVVLLAAGLSLLAVTLWREPGWRAAPSVLVTGSIALLLSYLLGARVGTEGAPDPSMAAALLFGAAGFLVPIGLILTAIKLRGLLVPGTAGTR